LGLSVASIAAALLFMAYAMFSMIPTAALAATATNDQPISTSSMLSRHQELIANYQQLWNHRALFFKPRVKPPEQIIVEPTTSEPQQTAPVFVDPVYAGPSLIALVGAKAWFKPPVSGASVLRLSIGQEQAGLALVSVDAPWTAHVRYHGKTYTLTLFDESRTDRHFRENPALNDASKALLDRNATMMMDDDVFGDQGSNR
jgi:hypothetical protein